MANTGDSNALECTIRHANTQVCHWITIYLHKYQLWIIYACVRMFCLSCQTISHKKDREINHFFSRAKVLLQGYMYLKSNAKTELFVHTGIVNNVINLILNDRLNGLRFCIKIEIGLRMA